MGRISAAARRGAAKSNNESLVMLHGAPHKALWGGGPICVSLLRVSMVREFLDVVHKAEEYPLPVHSRPAAQREAIDQVVASPKRRGGSRSGRPAACRHGSGASPSRRQSVAM